MKSINFKDLMVSYDEDRSLGFIKTYGVNYVEELTMLLKSVCDVDPNRVKLLCELPSIKESKDDLSFEVYKVAVSGMTHDESTMAIKNYLDGLLESFKNDELDYDQVYDLVSREPVNFPNLRQEFYAFVAAYLELKLRGTGIQIPEWVNDKFYCLSNPYFEGRKDKETIINSELCFSKRNYYCAIR